MKTKVCVLLAISALGASSSVFAGEGGVAGAISYQLDSTTGGVTSASAAIAVGKNSAYAGASTNIVGYTEAFAAGSGGIITTGGDVYIADTGVDRNLGTAQSNDLAAINMNALDTNGNLTQVVGPAPDLAPILVPAPAPTPAL